MPTPQKSQPMVLRGWRETMMAPTAEKMSSVTRSATTLADFVSPPNWRSATVELAARDNTSPPTSSATDSATSDQASQAAARLFVPPTPRPCSAVRCAMTPL